MKLSKGTFYLIKSRNRPVFPYGPIQIDYVVPPKKGQAFLFSQYPGNVSNTSTIQKVTKVNELVILHTLNSVYALEPRE